MSALSSRGGAHEVAEDATLSREAALRWAEKAQAATTKQELEKREAEKSSMLQTAVVVGTATGLAGSAAGWKWLRSRTPAFQRAVGGGGAAFTLFGTFFVPFVFTTNRCRSRWQRGKSFFDRGDASF